jgi:cytochrome c-type biogenesis protein CcmH
MREIEARMMQRRSFPYEGKVPCHRALRSDARRELRPMAGRMGCSSMANRKYPTWPEGEGVASQRFGLNFLVRIVFLLALLLVPSISFAVTPDEMLRDPKLEARARALSAQLRCMVCQNESIDESEATLARDIRHLVREKIAAGYSDAAILEFLVSRYGDFILLKPPLKIETLLLWGAPLLILLGSGTAIFVSTRRRKERREMVPASLSAAEQEKLAALVGKDEN